MIHILVDDMWKIESNPSTAQCLISARDIVCQYPQSFMDTMDDGTTTTGAGFESLLCQIKTCVEHLNRNNTLACHRKSKMHIELNHNENLQTLIAVQWQAEHPPEETEKSLENKRQKLGGFFSCEGSSGMESTEVLTFMETTYYLHWQMINSNPAPALEHLKQPWPYLLFPRSTCAHFEQLTGVPIV